MTETKTITPAQYIIAGKAHSGKTKSAISYAVNKLQQSESKELSLFIVNPEESEKYLIDVVKSVTWNGKHIQVRIIKTIERNIDNTCSVVQKIIDDIKTDDEEAVVIIENIPSNIETIPDIKGFTTQIATMNIPNNKDIQEFINDINYKHSCSLGLCERTEDGIEITFY